MQGTLVVVGCETGLYAGVIVLDVGLVGIFCPLSP